MKGEDDASSDEDFVVASDTSASASRKRKAPAARGTKAVKATTPRKKPKASASAPTTHLPGAQDIEELGKTCAFDEDQWYDEHQRTLPWRRRRTIDADGHVIAAPKAEGGDGADADDDDVGYGVWVSEIMLQQTRVETVIEYYNKWMKKWPTPHSLADATLEEVNEAWTGLGYYRRAKFLHEGAKELVRQHDGRLPRTAAELRKIPGIGPYTAGAIASIAYDQPAPLVDGNVIRVLSRLRAIKADSTNKKVVDLFWKLAGDLVDPKRPGCFNQAMMELGATVCTPKSPKCKACPVSAHCLALAEELDDARPDGASVTQYPYKPPKAKQREESVVVCVLERRRAATGGGRSSFLLVQRPASGLLASLWDFPSVNLGAKADGDAEVPRAQAERAIDDHLARLLGADHPVCRAIDHHHHRTQGRAGNEEEVAAEAEVERTYVGEATFLFSHIKHFYRVEWLRITTTDNDEDEDDVRWQTTTTKTTTKAKKTNKKAKKEEDEDDGDEEVVMRWLGEEELKEAAIPKGMKNCFALVEASRRKTPQERRKASVDSRKKQKSIAAFFNSSKTNKPA
ncbi:A/Gspecific adenine glycosylase [Acanthamoeba castellanii str. Neff]|uniref:Adenine DNA glycosylase n=1 Tax=Acanthamoeba castellanii (strain ATCC 30010 / Neff) TaxID=1257118 RepID=L8H9X4_ACACF|nr:A/Gspecific adenine glycosylase [Acanthamoeba castellanii str. Neff]ELR22329.1 A/Gspecific adenine glycosylase [Acanthamoeba castellanii str. Neff]